jgi:hypothetical protein
MSFAKSAGVVSTILFILALVATLLKSIIAFVGFLTTALQILIVLAFVTVIVGVGVMVFRTWSANKKQKS